MARWLGTRPDSIDREAADGHTQDAKVVSTLPTSGNTGKGCAPDPPGCGVAPNRLSSGNPLQQLSGLDIEVGAKDIERLGVQSAEVAARARETVGSRIAEVGALAERVRRDLPNLHDLVDPEPDHWDTLGLIRVALDSGLAAHRSTIRLPTTNSYRLDSRGRHLWELAPSIDCHPATFSENFLHPPELRCGGLWPEVALHITDPETVQRYILWRYAALRYILASQVQQEPRRGSDARGPWHCRIRPDSDTGILPSALSRRAPMRRQLPHFAR